MLPRRLCSTYAQVIVRSLLVMQKWRGIGGHGTFVPGGIVTKFVIGLLATPQAIEGGFPFVPAELCQAGQFLRREGEIGQ